MPDDFEDARVKAVFSAYPAALRSQLLTLRALIFEVARETDSVGEIVETLKWGQPSYLPRKPRVGTTVRIDRLKNDEDKFALYFHCQTTLMRSFKDRYPDVFDFDGNRALILSQRKRLPRQALKHCIAMALTYHLRRRSK